MLVLALVPLWLTAILASLFLFFCVLLILVVLIQRPMGGGLSGAFGSGAGSGQTAFGAKTGDALTYATITIFTIYLLFAVGLNYAARPTVGGGATAATVPAPTGAKESAPASTLPPPLQPVPSPTGVPPAGATGATGSSPAPAPTGTFVPPAPAPTAPTGAPAGTGPPPATPG